MDVAVQNEGSIVLFRPLTRPARQWIEEYVDPEAQWWAGALVVEPRYAGDLTQGMLDAGLRVG